MEGTEVSGAERITVTYEAVPVTGSSPEHLARAIAYEQTVELPAGTYPDRVEQEIVGRVEHAALLDSGHWRLVISYEPALAGDEVPQFLNLVFGNVSLLPGVSITAADVPAGTARAFGGPRRGLAGFRAATGVSGRPLVCSAAKPVGLTAAELALRCRELALGGVDIVKDDHGVMNQGYAAFDDRVRRLQDAVADANAATGGRTLYFPNVSGPIDRLRERAELARAVGCAGVLLNPFLTGLDAIRWVADLSGLLVLAHPTFAGSATGAADGLAPAFLYGRLLRLLGADGVIFIASGGRFPVPAATVGAIVDGLHDSADPLAPALPVLGGGIDVASVRGWKERLGNDVMFLIGSSIYRTADLRGGAQALMEEIAAGS